MAGVCRQPTSWGGIVGLLPPPPHWQSLGALCDYESSVICPRGEGHLPIPAWGLGRVEGSRHCCLWCLVPGLSVGRALTWPAGSLQVRYTSSAGSSCMKNKPTHCRNSPGVQTLAKTNEPNSYCADSEMLQGFIIFSGVSNFSFLSLMLGSCL